MLVLLLRDSKPLLKFTTYMYKKIILAGVVKRSWKNRIAHFLAGTHCQKLLEMARQYNIEDYFTHDLTVLETRYDAASKHFNDVSNHAIDNRAQHLNVLIADLDSKPGKHAKQELKALQAVKGSCRSTDKRHFKLFNGLSDQSKAGQSLQ